jgi:hypothetical protein
MPRFRFFQFLLCSMLLATLLLAGKAKAEEAWSLYKKADGISMHQRHVDVSGQKILEIKVQLEYQGSIGAFLHLLADTNNAALWLHNVAQVKLLGKKAANEDLVYSRFSAPWPLADRELVSCSDWAQDDGFTLNVEVGDCGDLYPQNPGKVRIRNFTASWQLFLRPDGKVQLLYTGTADAGGAVPRFFSDPITLSSSWKSFNGLKRQIEKPQYQKPYAGICEIPHNPANTSDDFTNDMPCAQVD